ncbi:MAG: division/cell wall cluster transcriptional repressor MraZ [Bacteroidales bacterium]|jgi:MraZ protein|nr:division/cell wall cluster transcriptional repressor MraZ [Bacteroidales bacterium]
MINLIGTYECKVDAKGRLMLPAGLKKQIQPILNEGFIIKRSVFQKCLELYPMTEWNQEITGVNKLNRFVKKNTDFIRMFMAGVRTLEIDNAGRILIPKDLAKFSDIKREIVLASSVNRIEIWNKNLYEEILNDPNIDFGALAEDVMGNVSSDEE